MKSNNNDDHTNVKDLNLNIVADGGVLVIRQGYEAEPLPLKEPVRLKLAGSVESLLDFAKKRPELLDPKISHLIIVAGDGSNLQATFVHDETSPYSAEVVGKLVANKEVSELGINTSKKYDTHALISALKMKRHLFESREAQAAILTALKTFNGNITTEFKDTNDFAGNVVYSKITKCTTNLVLEFNLSIAPFIGSKASTVQVIVEVEPSPNNHLTLNLVSYDLVDVIKENADKAKKELFEAFAAVPIIQS